MTAKPITSTGSAFVPRLRSAYAAPRPIGSKWAVGGQVTGRRSCGSLAASTASLENSSAVKHVEELEDRR